MKNLLVMFVFMIFLLFPSGCYESAERNDALLESFIDLAKTSQAVNTASAPVNPYVLPIGIGLAALVPLLEALRRKEKSGRKFAEGKLNGNNNSAKNP